MGLRSKKDNYIRIFLNESSVLTPPFRVFYHEDMQSGITVKPGIATSEFWGTLITMGIGVFVFAGVLPAERAQEFTSELLQFLSLCVQIFTLVSGAYITIKPIITYIQGRVTLKNQLITQQRGIM